MRGAYDQPSEVQVPVSKLDQWALSINGKGNIDPTKPQNAGEIQRIADAIAQGQISESGVNNIVKYNPRVAPVLYDALGQYKQAAGSRQSIGKYFDPGSPGQPAIQEDYMGRMGPTQSGGSLPPVQPGRPEVPATPQRADFDAAIAKAYQMGNYPLAAQLSNSKKDANTGKSGGLYGGIQYAFDPKTKKYVPYSVDESTRQAVKINTPEGTLATIPMTPQAVMGPGGVSSIVQIPTRGIPGPQGNTGTGLIPNHPQSMDVAGRLSMLDQAEKDVTDAKALIFSADGKLNKKLLAEMSVPGTAGVGGSARTAYSAIENAIAAKLRAETGAAASPGEVANIAKRFRPGVLDTDASAKYKLDRLLEYVSSPRKIVDPSGLYRKQEETTPRPGISQNAPAGWKIERVK